MSSAWHQTVPFAPFLSLFTELGWTHQVIPGSHQLFVQPGKRFDVMLPLPKRGRLPAPYIIVVGRTLDDLGEMDRDTVERRLTPPPRRPRAGGRRTRPATPVSA